MAKGTDCVRAELRSPVQGIKSCLDQLEDEARGYGLTRAAALIDEELVRASKSSSPLMRNLH